MHVFGLWEYTPTPKYKTLCGPATVMTTEPPYRRHTQEARVSKNEYRSLGCMSGLTVGDVIALLETVATFGRRLWAVQLNSPSCAIACGDVVRAQSRKHELGDFQDE